MSRRIKKLLHEQSTWHERLADRITKIAGSMGFVYFHVFFFGIWLLVHTFDGFISWDPYPFNFLTLVVSLEAIFLSTFVLISQNREAQQTDIREQLDYEVDVKAEGLIEEVVKRLDRIESKMTANGTSGTSMLKQAKKAPSQQETRKTEVGKK